MDDKDCKKMASPDVLKHPERDTNVADLPTTNVKHARLASQVYFVVMVLGIWLGVALPPIGGGLLNGAFLIAGAYATYRVFTGIRVSV
jgi:hypothetical protein